MGVGVFQAPQHITLARVCLHIQCRRLAHLNLWKVHVAKAIIPVHEIWHPVLLDSSKGIMGTLCHRNLHSERLCQPNKSQNCSDQLLDLA